MISPPRHEQPSREVVVVIVALLVFGGSGRCGMLARRFLPNDDGCEKRCRLQRLLNGKAAHDHHDGEVECCSGALRQRD